MRKLFAICFVAFAVSCSAEDVLEGQGQTEQPVGETVFLEVSLNQTTKTSLGEKVGSVYAVNWDAGDCISVNGRGGASALTADQDGITDNPDRCPIGKCLDGGRNLHPNEAGMEVIANKIYTELGSWLEE